MEAQSKSANEQKRDIIRELLDSGLPGWYNLTYQARDADGIIKTVHVESVHLDEDYEPDSNIPRVSKYPAPQAPRQVKLDGVVHSPEMTYYGLQCMCTWAPTSPQSSEDAFDQINRHLDAMAFKASFTVDGTSGLNPAADVGPTMNVSRETSGPAFARKAGS